MNRNRMLTMGMTVAVLALCGANAVSAQDKYTVKVPGGLEFAEFRV
jgi:hypothetical protein